MTRRELYELLDGVYDGDEVIFLSPGGRALEVTQIDHARTNETGAVCIDTVWKDMRTDEEIENGEEDPVPIVQRKVGRPKGTTKEYMQAKRRREVTTKAKKVYYQKQKEERKEERMKEAHDNLLAEIQAEKEEIKRRKAEAKRKSEK